MEIRKISIKKLGPLHQAEMEAGDLTVLVGPQATGKSLCLQSIKLFLDAGNIKEILRGYGFDWHRERDGFLSIFFGEGMNGAWGKATQLVVNDQPLSWTGIESRRYADPRAYYIPAQRVMTMENSWPRPFTFIEVHPAETSEVPNVLNKLCWLHGFIKREIPELYGTRFENKYSWVGTGGVHIIRTSREFRLVAQNGLHIAAHIEI